MNRTQLLLEPWQLEALRSTAEREGGSISSVVRRILTEALRGGRPAAGTPRAPRLADLEGAIRDAGFSVRDHDQELYGEIFRRAEKAAAPSVSRDGGGRSYGAGTPRATDVAGTTGRSSRRARRPRKKA